MSRPRRPRGTIGKQSRKIGVVGSAYRIVGVESVAPGCLPTFGADRYVSDNLGRRLCANIALVGVEEEEFIVAVEDLGNPERAADACALSLVDGFAVASTGTLTGMLLFRKADHAPPEVERLPSIKRQKGSDFPLARALV